MTKEEELIELCKEFIAKNEITCAEAIYLNGKVEPNVNLLIEKICDIVGYYNGIAQTITQTCPGCNCEIDPEICHCGIEYKNHSPYTLGHNFVPMGCQCCYHREG